MIVAFLGEILYLIKLVFGQGVGWMGEVVCVNRVKRENERTGVCDYGQAGFFKGIGWADGGCAYS